MGLPQKILLGSLLTLGITSAFASDSADLKVRGTIAPSACTPAFAGGGTVDYGNISPTSLSETVQTRIGTKDVAFTITCNAPISIATSWSDSRSDSPLGGNATGQRYGLGLQDGKPIGYYNVGHKLADTLADGAPVDLIVRQNDTDEWKTATGDAPTKNDSTRIHSFADPATLVPGAYTNYSGTLQVTTFISRTDQLDMSNAIILDGLSTMTVKYL